MSRFQQDGRQVDMFGAFAALDPPREISSGQMVDQPPSRAKAWHELELEEATAEEEAALERGFPGYAEADENELGEQVERFELERIERQRIGQEAWALERQRIADAIEAATAAGRTRTIQWGKAKRDSCVWGGAGWIVELYEHDGQVFIGRADLELHNSGGYHGNCQIEGARTLDEGALHVFRKQLRDCAKETRGHSWEDARAKQCDQLARWIIEECPPLLYGADLAAELEQMRTKYGEQEKLRCAAIRAGAKSYIGVDGNELSIYSI